MCTKVPSVVFFLISLKYCWQQVSFFIFSVERERKMATKELHVWQRMFLFKLGKAVAEAKMMIVETYENGSVGNSMFCEWFIKFKVDLTWTNNATQEFESDDI